MSWSTTADLRAQVQKRWDRGELLRDRVTHCMTWPLRLTVKTPSSSELSDRFGEVREWARALGGAEPARIEWRERKHRVHGVQRLPFAAWVDSLDAALAWIDQIHQARRFEALWQQTSATQGSLLTWLAKHPLEALKHADDWHRLLLVIEWLQARPRPGIYLRQVDVPGIDSKFIEKHRGLLTELLDLSLSADAIDSTGRGPAKFARRFGFLDKPVRIRFRPLDAALTVLADRVEVSDMSLDAASFARITLPVARVFVTENEINYLSFPPVERAIAIFGEGYGWDALARADWLQGTEMHYWGDIDTHGFAILDQLRKHFPRVTSFLMDRRTLLAHRAHWHEEASPTRQDLGLLTPEEASLYDDLRYDRLQARLRLEQERVGYGWLLERLRAIVE